MPKNFVSNKDETLRMFGSDFLSLVILAVNHFLQFPTQLPVRTVSVRRHVRDEALVGRLESRVVTHIISRVLSKARA